ncbi:hypothetical protein P872_01510 [Rhodonellum psychrophilum GCM71 = DSM 17998]|uniref:Glycoside hydrolase 123 catalytic domain-containing protein n=2 Tax=Rhodonellum TaxID=336827 RepID=U5BTM6_9BACT|nr:MULTISPECIES: DUF4091 domain-containing protein [Rhodonellum]ERM83965.1 hypothetical protein P872_01510 [Rhodonellum psychrophilum GCM71 = DSM 17998]SDZ05660.1 protein of unknown function [Rhodonellum ikkaensis]
MMKFPSLCAVLTILYLLPNLSIAQESLKANFTTFELFGDELEGTPTFKGWKNETVPLILKIKSTKSEKINFKVKIGNKRVSYNAYQLAYVKGDFSSGVCGEAKKSGKFEIGYFPDRAVEIFDRCIQPDSTVHYLLLNLNISKNAKTGKYPISVEIKQGESSFTSSSQLEIIDRTLPSFAELDFKMDFWQYPLSVANYYKVDPWSDAHMKHLGVMFDQLNHINQKAVTTTVFWDIFNTSIKPLEEMMIQVRRNKDGHYSYDYSNFEKYVKLGFSKGVDQQISVHNLFPWNNFLFYFDETQDKVVSSRNLPMSSEYQKFWKAFLEDFSKYLEKKDWLEKVVFFIDERTPEQSIEISKFVKSIEPKFKMGYSGKYYEALSPYIDDYSLSSNIVLEKKVLDGRRAAGHSTTFYTSCYEKQPNMLMMSNYGDIYFILMLAKAKGYDGFLRWAFNLWSSDIVDNAIYPDLPSGDAHFVYPNGQVSLRYLIIHDALEEVLKIKSKENLPKTADMLKAHNRYFLLNIEKSRLEMIRSMKTYLND